MTKYLTGMKRRDFTKKVGGAGIAVIAGVGILAATAPKMILLVNDNEDFKLTVVYHPTWDGPIERWEQDPCWEVIRK